MSRLLLLSLLAMALAPTLAMKSPVPVLAVTKESKSAKELAKKMWDKEDLPPLEVDVQLDFDLAFTPSKPKQKPKAKPKAKPKKKVAPRKAPAAARAPPPPRVVAKPVPRAVVATKKVAPPKKLVSHKKKVPRKSLSAHLGDVQKRLSTSRDRISEHKYAKVVWATLLFVWTPLLLIWIANKFLGKEFLIDVLVRILPEQVPASWIEMAIEDGLWVGIFGVCVMATAGTLLVETTTLALDFVKGTKNTKTKTSISTSTKGGREHPHYYCTVLQGVLVRGLQYDRVIH